MRERKTLMSFTIHAVWRPAGCAPDFGAERILIILGDQVELHAVPGVAHQGALPDVIKRLGLRQQLEAEHILIELDAGR